MREVLLRNAHKLAYLFIGSALALTFVAATIGAFRLHHSASLERQTIRTQQLETALLERDPAAVETAYRNVAAHDAAEGRRLHADYAAFIRTPVRTRAFERQIEAELSRQSSEIHRINPAARAALIAAVVGAALPCFCLSGCSSSSAAPDASIATTPRAPRS